MNQKVDLTAYILNIKISIGNLKCRSSVVCKFKGSRLPFKLLPTNIKALKMAQGMKECDKKCDELVLYW